MGYSFGAVYFFVYILTVFTVAMTEKKKLFVQSDKKCHVRLCLNLRNCIFPLKGFTLFPMTAIISFRPYSSYKILDVVESTLSVPRSNTWEVCGIYWTIYTTSFIVTTLSCCPALIDVSSHVTVAVHYYDLNERSNK